MGAAWQHGDIQCHEERFTRCARMCIAGLDIIALQLEQICWYAAGMLSQGGASQIGIFRKDDGLACLQQAVDTEDALPVAEEDLDDARKVQHRLGPVQWQLAGDVVVLQVDDEHLQGTTSV